MSGNNLPLYNNGHAIAHPSRAVGLFFIMPVTYFDAYYYIHGLHNYAENAEDSPIYVTLIEQNKGKVN